MNYNKYEQALHDAILGDTWEKLVSHEDFLLWVNYVRNKQEKEARELFDKIMKEIN